jgi:hypothetical protein
MSKSKAAKTGSKNNPLARASAKVILYNGTEIVPVRFVSETSSYIAAAYKGGDMVCDIKGNPIPWRKIS